MVKRSILSDDELAQGAQAIADDVRIGGTGRLMLARVIDDHLGWFEKAQARGLQWTDIIDVLFRAGVTRLDGRPLSRGHLSSLVWRKQKSAMATIPAPVTAPASKVSRQKSKRQRSPLPSAATPRAGEKPPSTVGSNPAPTPATIPGAKPAVTPSGAKGEPAGHDKLLAYMRRSARARGGD